jgi:hypothetical protein
MAELWLPKSAKDPITCRNVFTDACDETYLFYKGKCARIRDELEFLKVTNNEEIEMAWNWASRSKNTSVEIIRYSAQWDIKIEQDKGKVKFVVYMTAPCYLVKNNKGFFDIVSIEKMERDYFVTKPPKGENE